MGVPQNGWFIRETSIKMDDLGAPLFQETTKSRHTAAALPLTHCLHGLEEWELPGRRDK